jgi:formate--tetrahydrofolate ligase
VTEAGFGSDLGAEKFFDIKCRLGDLKPNAIVLVATIRALKHHGGGYLTSGIENLGKHIDNLKKFGLPVVVALNQFSSDTAEERQVVSDYCAQRQVKLVVSDVWARGSQGGRELAHEVLRLAKQPNSFDYLYNPKMGIKKAVELLAREIYGADGVNWSPQAKRNIKRYKNWGVKNLPVCVAKTQASLSDNPKLLGRPKGFKITVKEVKLNQGANFFVIIAGNILRMPGLPKTPAAEQIDINKQGQAVGLF